MSDQERADPSNGIWLCNRCAKLIDSDEPRFSVENLNDWKKSHDTWVAAGRPTSRQPVREISVRGDGLGSLISNADSGIGPEVQGAGGQVAERIEVIGRGIGEIVTNTGRGTGKVVGSIATTASETRVNVNSSVRMAAGMISTVKIVVCGKCRGQFSASKVIQGFAGDVEPTVEIACPHCGQPTTV